MDYNVVRGFLLDELFECDEGIFVFVAMEFMEPGTFNFDSVENCHRMRFHLREDSFVISKQHYQLGMKLIEKIELRGNYFEEMYNFLVYQTGKYISKRSKAKNRLINRTLRYLDFLDDRMFEVYLEDLKADILVYNSQTILDFKLEEDIIDSIALIRDSMVTVVSNESWYRFVHIINLFNRMRIGKREIKEMEMA